MICVSSQALFLVAVLSFPGASAEAEPSTAPATIRFSSVESLDQLTATGQPATNARPRHPRVLLIISKASTRCGAELARLSKPGGEFDKLRSTGWTIGEGPANHLQIVRSETLPELVEQLNVREYPTVACIDHGEVLRSFKDGCTTPLDAWTFGWLAKGIDERPEGMVSEAARVETTGHFPLRGNHWSIDGDWTPSRDGVISHLRGGNHGWQLSASWGIEAWSYEELRSLHDYLHERYGGGISASSRAKSSPPQFSASRKAAS